MVEAVLFDMDGVLVDTEMIQSKAFESVLHRFGVIPKKNEHNTVHVSGATTPETWIILQKEYGFEADIEELTKLKRDAVMHALRGKLEPMPGVVALLNDLKINSVRLAVVSSAQRERVEHVLNQLGIADFFEASISANDVERGKPAPDPYLAAARLLSVDPTKCVVIEDAKTGLESAKAAHMKVIAAPNEYTKRMDFSAADLILPSLNDLNFEKIAQL